VPDLNRDTEPAMYPAKSELKRRVAPSDTSLSFCRLVAVSATGPGAGSACQPRSRRVPRSNSALFAARGLAGLLFVTLPPAVAYRRGMAEESRAELAQVLGDLAIEMQAQTDTETTLHTIVRGAVNIVPGARWVGISLIQGRQVRSRAPSDPLVAELDKMQTSLNEGPCLSALREHHTVLIDDMARDTRWPASRGQQ
jgi:hypothetical protein